MTGPGPTSAARVPMRVSAPEFPRINSILRAEQERHGQPRHITQAVACSPSAWRATTNAMHIYAQLRAIDMPTVDLICLYTSLLNGCRYCIDDAAGEALARGRQAEDMLALGGDLGAVFPAATVACLDFARAITLDPAAVSDEQVSGLREHFSNEAVLEITLVVAMKNFWNRFATSLRIPPEGKCADQELFASLVRLSDQLRARRCTAP
jgi:AhpD family alkylhydroperoxidase